MSYDSREKSEQLGEPIEFCKFVRGSSEWLYTSARQQITHGDNTYLPSFKRGKIAQTRDNPASPLDIELPAQAAVLAPWRGEFTNLKTRVVISRYHEGEALDTRLIWSGYISTVSFGEDGALGTARCEGTAAYVASIFPVEKLTRQCRVEFGAAECGVDLNFWTLTRTVVAIDDKEIQFTPAYPTPNHYTGGVAVFTPLSGEVQTRTIMTHFQADKIQVKKVFYGLSPGDTLQLTAGCDRSRSMCALKYSNSANFRGAPLAPTRSPFDNGAL